MFYYSRFFFSLLCQISVFPDWSAGSCAASPLPGWERSRTPPRRSLLPPSPGSPSPDPGPLLRRSPVAWSPGHPCVGVPSHEVPDPPRRSSSLQVPDPQPRSRTPQPRSRTPAWAPFFWDSWSDKPASKTCWDYCLILSSLSVVWLWIVSSQEMFLWIEF